MLLRSHILVLFLLIHSALFAEETQSAWKSLGLEEKPRFLAPDRAFGVDASLEGDFLDLKWRIAKGYYLYKEKISISSGELPEIGANLFLPKGELHEDPEFGKVEIYRDSLHLKYPIDKITVLPNRASLLIGYQGCAEAGLCYAPVLEEISVSLNRGEIFGVSSITSQNIRSSDIHMLILSFMGFGLLLSMTPCVLPMLPILSGILVGRHTPVNSGRAFYLSTIYVFSMAVTYSCLGVLIALLGRGLQTYLHHTFSILVLSSIFFFLGFSMLGFYNLEIPRFIKEPLDRVAKEATPNTLKGVASMGALSALIATPCVTPPLAAVLTYVADSGSPSKGALALFSLGLGMGLPLIAFGTSVGVLIPRSGRWMQSIKILLGLVLLGFAIWFVSRVLPEMITTWVWIIFVGSSLAYFGYGFLKESEILGPSKVKVLAYLCLSGFVIITATFFTLDNGKFKQILEFNRQGAVESLEAVTSVNNLADLNSQIILSAQSGRPIVVEFYADWCIECKRMESKTLRDQKVRDLLTKFTFVRIDITQNTKAHQSILEYYNLFGPPAILFFSDTFMAEVRREIGFIEAKQFSKALESVLAERS
ncbi:MAG: protein-disulfide reductase DsbD [Pseudomonadota bacterium]|nr:protein-disulfide reductase DsbD [Pseudomonadota bacterium]